MANLTLLSNLLGSPAQSRSFPNDGNVVYRATLNDGSQRIEVVRVP